MPAPLFHISEQAGIARFEPRPVQVLDARVGGLAVWAIDEAHLPNYLVPRDCPRVTFAADASTTLADRDRFVGALAERRVIAIAPEWVERAHTTPIHLYEMPPKTFRCIDKDAGHYVSDVAVTPLSCRTISDPLSELTARPDIEVRLINDLMALHRAVAASTLSFSSTRIRTLTPSVQH